MWEWYFCELSAVQSDLATHRSHVRAIRSQMNMIDAVKLFLLTPKVRPEAVVVFLEEAVQEDGDVTDGVVVADVS